MNDSNYFVTLCSVNVNDKIEKKNGLSYLSWAYAWAELKKRFPEATYTIYENADGWNYHTDLKTAWVKVGVTVNGIEHIEELPIMDFKNKSIPLEHITSFEVNKAIQRALTKAVARHGLGLYIYAGEDLPEESDGKITPKKTASKAATPKAAAATNQPSDTSELEPPKSSRDLLREYCKKYGIEPAEIVHACKLRQDSSESEWAAALLYAKRKYGGS